VTRSFMAVRSGLVLLTGSEGAIGSQLRSVLQDSGYQVRGLDIRPARQRHHDHRVADLCDPSAVRAAMRGVDAVVHAGAIPNDRGDGLAVMSTNVVGTWTVLQAAVEAGVQRVIGISSVNAQGSVGGHRETEYLPVDDDYPHHPMTPYQLSKHLMEEVCRSYSERHGLPTLCLRPVWIARPGGDDAQGFGSDAFVERWRDDLWAYVDVRDVSDAVLRCLSLEGVLHDRFLLAARDTSVQVDTNSLVEQGLATVPWLKIERDRYLAGQRYRSLIDCRHAREVLGWEARHSWRDRSAATCPA
jgi:UDP-glucose 4-epimerase